MKEYKVIGLSVAFFVLVACCDAVFESLVSGEKSFLSSLILDVSSHAIFLRALVTVCFLLFGLIVSGALARSRRAEAALREEQLKYRSLFEEAKRSEELYRSLLNSSPDPIVIYNLEGHPQYLNDSFVRTFGWTLEEVQGRRIPFVPDSEGAATGEAVRRIMGDGESVSGFKTKRHTKDGRVLDIRLTASRFHDAAGRPAGMLVILRNITGRIRAEEETRRIKSLLDSIIENLPTAVFLKDAENLTYVLWNKACEELCGYSSADVMGKSAYDLFSQESADQFTSQDKETLKSGELVRTREQTVTSGRKGTRILDSKKLPIVDEDGTARYVLCISEDITERKANENALIEARRAAEQASRAKSEFLANMSHEIRTPIHGMMGMTELALNTELTPEQTEYLEAVRISADSLLKLINDILDFSKIEAGKLELIDVPFSLRDTIADAMTILAVQAHKKDLELLYHIAPEIPDEIIGDPGRLRQVLVNLVGNSIKFTDRGEVVVRVSGALAILDEVNLHVTVSDTGIGIPAEKQAQIFRAFEQADGSTSRKYGGTGLGLAISLRFCELMGGRIWVESEVGKGSTFHFTARLRLRKDPGAPPIALEISALKGMPVLVVDDNATNRKILEQILLYWGMEPTVVDSGSAALAALTESRTKGAPFRLVLTDCMMPEMDGFQLVEQINQTTDLAASTIIMLTSAGERGDAARCLKLHIAAYLLKPVKQSELLFTISRVLQEPSVSQAQPTLITRHSIRESKQRLRILLAEDNAVNQKLATKMLQRIGHRVTVAGNGIAALEMLETEPFDLVLMDVQMPGMDGLEATRVLREREKATGTHLAVVAMTAYAMKGDREKCLEAGMDGYISKPITAQQLYETIEHHVHDVRKPVAQGPVSSTASGILDKSRILAWLGGDAKLLEEVVTLFLDVCPGLLVEIRDAVNRGDAGGLEAAAHSLKGSVSNFANESATQAALRVESIARSRDLTEAPEAITLLEMEIARVTEELAVLRKEIRS